MAEAIARDMGIANMEFASAGTRASTAQPATGHAITAMTELGIDVADHRAQTLETALRDGAARIYAMTRDHVAIVKERFPDLAHSVELLDVEGAEIADPYGQDLQTYRGARDLIAAAVEARAAEWEPD